MFLKLDISGSVKYLSIYQVRSIEPGDDDATLITLTNGDTITADNSFIDLEALLVAKKQVFNAPIEE